MVETGDHKKSKKNRKFRVYIYLIGETAAVETSPRFRVEKSVETWRVTALEV